MLIKNTIKPIGKHLETHSFVMVRCPTKASAKSLSDHLHSKGYKWRTDKKIQNNSKWDIHKEDTVYLISSIPKRVTLSNITQKAGVVYAKR